MSAVFRKFDPAYGRVQVETAAANRERLAHSSEQMSDKGFRYFSRLRAKKDELISCQPENRAAGRQDCFESRAEFHQRSVAIAIAKRIVDLLESGDVDHEEIERRPGFDGVRQVSFEREPVFETGQRIPASHCCHLVVAGVEIGRVGDEADSTSIKRVDLHIEPAAYRCRISKP